MQYQFGYKQAITPDLGLELSSTFYKDIRDLLGVEFITTYNDAEYARLTNVDFGSVVGLHADRWTSASIGPLSSHARLHLADRAAATRAIRTRPRRAPRRARIRGRARCRSTGTSATR